MQQSVHIQPADFASLARHASIVILGRRRSGKSTFARWLVKNYLMDTYPRVVVMAGNKHCADCWSAVVPPLFCMEKNIDHLQAIRDYQEKKLRTLGTNDIPTKYDVCIVFDDCGSDKSFMRSNIMRDLQANGRHYGIAVVVLAQYLVQISSENRDQIDYLAVLHTSNAKNTKRIYEEFVNVGDLRSFKYTMAALTQNRGVCWIDNTCTPSKLDEVVFYYRARFDQLGSHAESHMWDFSNYHIRDTTIMEVEDESEDADDVLVEEEVLNSIVDRRGQFDVCIQKIKTD